MLTNIAFCDKIYAYSKSTAQTTSYTSVGKPPKGNLNMISVIIIAYNVEKYISEAIKSVTAQTMKDLEIVIVDDHSSDKTFDIISEYEKQDKRIKVIRHEENRSANIARLTAIKHTHGDYVIFLDGDDMLSPDTCKKAYNAIRRENVDMLSFDFELNFEPPMQPNHSIENDFRNMMCAIPRKCVSSSPVGLLDEDAVGGSINFQLWGKIYKREIVEKAASFVPNEYMNMAEDVLLGFLLQYHSSSYSMIYDKLYIYRFGCGMSTVSELTDRHINYIAKSAYAYTHIRSFVENAGTEKECAKALYHLHKHIYRNILGTYLERISEEHYDTFISDVLKYGSVDDLLLASSYFLGNERYPKLIAEKCSLLEMFKTTKTEAQTVGLYYFRAYNGGIEKVMSLLSDIWLKAGYKVVLFTDEEPNKLDYHFDPSIKRVTVPAMKERDHFNYKNRITNFRKSLIENDIDIMIYNAWDNPDIVIDEMIIKSCGVALAVHTHNMFCINVDHPDANCAYLHASLRTYYLFADSVIAITDVDAAYWNAMGFKTLKTKNPIEFDINTEPAQLNGNSLLLVARISWEKQIIDAIKIAELVQKEIPDVKLTIVGKGDEPSYIKKVDDYIASNNLKSLVNMVGFSSNVLPYYKAADVQLITSAFEGFCLTLMEGKLCGLPLVCYELPNLDITKDGRGTTLIKQSDIRGAADAVIKILKDDALKKEMGREARKSAEEFFDIDLAQNWKNIFEQTLQPKCEDNIYARPDTEIAFRIAMEKYSEGLYNYLNNVNSKNANSEIAGELADAKKRIAFFDREVINIRNSDIYRVGAIITFIPRKLKALFLKLFKRKNRP